MKRKGRKPTHLGIMCPHCKSANVRKSGSPVLERAGCLDCGKTFKRSAAITPTVQHLSAAFVYAKGPCEMYDAFATPNMIHVMGDIVGEGDKYRWNCYDIGEFSTRKELVLHYLDIKEFGLKEYLHAAGKI